MVMMVMNQMSPSHEIHPNIFHSTNIYVTTFLCRCNKIFVVTMSGICSDKSRGRWTFGSSPSSPSPSPPQTHITSWASGALKKMREYCQEGTKSDSGYFKTHSRKKSNKWFGILSDRPDCQVVRQVRVAHQTGKCVPGKVASRLVSRSKVRLSPVLVSCPLKLGGVGMTCAHVLGLQMLHLREDVEPACAVCSRHFDKWWKWLWNNQQTFLLF